MKLKKSYILLASAALLTGACSENAWNDHLDGFQVPGAAEGVSNATYTLTSDDYATIASLAANKAIAEELGDDEVEALALVGTSGTFTTDEQARRYIPALLATTDKNLPFYTYNDESNVKVTYNVTTELPEAIQSINRGVVTYTVNEEDYQMVWGSEEDFINAFAPMKPASGNIPQLLYNNVTAKAGQYAIVTYNEATANPVFGDAGSTEPAGPTWSETSIAGAIDDAAAEKGETIEIHGIVTAIDARGFIVTDKSGSILCYQASGYDQNAVPLYSEVIISGPVSVYNHGYQLSIDSSSYTVCGEGEYTYPTPKVVTGADMDAAIALESNFHPQYVQFTGKASVSGNYYNITVDGASTAIGSLYMTPDYIKAMVTDGETYTFTGYYMAISGGKYYNLVCTDVAAPGKAPKRRTVKRAAVGVIETSVKNAIYLYDGSNWKVASDLIVLSNADYTAMGSTYGNLSGTQPEQYIPTYLKSTYPYAAEGDAKIVAYLYYNGSSTAYAAKNFVLTNGVWTINAGEATSQFTKTDNEWKFNPSVVIDLPYSRNTDPSYTYYIACMDWVFTNISEPMGFTWADVEDKNIETFIDYRKNAEFYSGASAYYGNVDVRASTALSHAPEGYTGYDGLTNDEITLLLKKRFCTEVFPGALEKLNGDMMPADGMDVTVTVNFTAYDGGAVPSTVVYTVVAPGKFRYKSSTWVNEGEDADWK